MLLLLLAAAATPAISQSNTIALRFVFVEGKSDDRLGRVGGGVWVGVDVGPGPGWADLACSLSWARDEEGLVEDEALTSPNSASMSG